ncbi:MAG: hypothetical protein ACJ751_24290 [Niastella sp.]
MKICSEGRASSFNTTPASSTLKRNNELIFDFELLRIDFPLLVNGIKQLR